MYAWNPQPTDQGAESPRSRSVHAAYPDRNGATRRLVVGDQLALGGPFSQLPCQLGRAETRNLGRDSQPDTSRFQPWLYGQALMELGATVCTPQSPSCGSCPVREHCRAFGMQEAGTPWVGEGSVGGSAEGSARVSVTDFPAKATKKPPVDHRFTVAVAVVEGENGAEDEEKSSGGGAIGRRRYLLARRPDSGLLAGTVATPPPPPHVISQRACYRNVKLGPLCRFYATATNETATCTTYAASTTNTANTVAPVRPMGVPLIRA